MPIAFISLESRVHPIMIAYGICSSFKYILSNRSLAFARRGDHHQERRSINTNQYIRGSGRKERRSEPGSFGTIWYLFGILTSNLSLTMSKKSYPAKVHAVDSKLRACVKIDGLDRWLGR